MEKTLNKNRKTLGKIASDKAIQWEDAAKSLPDNDPLAELGLLADLLNIPLAAAMDPDITEAQFREMAAGGQVDG